MMNAGLVVIDIPEITAVAEKLTLLLRELRNKYEAAGPMVAVFCSTAKISTVSVGQSGGWELFFWLLRMRWG
jgi:SepF-like predicted cell division protein (DUF552 family)